jgi:hypothetical protein
MGMVDAVSGYAYVGNNPINLIDPMGLMAAEPQGQVQSSYPQLFNMVACAPACTGLGIIPGRAAAAMAGGTPGYQGLQEQKPGNDGYQGLFGQQTGTPPSTAQQIGSAIGGFVNGAIDGATNLGNLIFKSDSRTLGNNLEASGAVRPPDTAAHHIVPTGSNNPDAIEARNKLQGFGIDINSAANGVFLPSTKGSQAPGAYHPSLHTDDYYNAVNGELRGARTPGQAVDILNDIRGRLLNNNFPN